ncbi:MAG: outer membrane lipoprotein carrier protein LolA [Candidatus Thorarchaeota archaeon]
MATSLALVLCLFLPSASAEPPTGGKSPPASTIEDVLGRLEERMSAMQTLRTDFIQEKHLAVLDRPLVLKGTVFMQKPGLFAWHVREPLRYSMVIRGETVRQWDEDSDRVQEISLSKNPAFGMAIRQMRDWFSGAYRSMLGDYEVALVDQAPVSLRVIPRNTALARQVIGSVTVVFERDERYIKRIEVVEEGGDRTLLTFVDTLLNSPIDPSAWKFEQRVR